MPAPPAAEEHSHAQASRRLTSNPLHDLDQEAVPISELRGTGNFRLLHVRIVGFRELFDGCLTRKSESLAATQK